MMRFPFSRLACGDAPKLVTLALVLLIPSLFTGCIVPPVNDAARIGPFYTPRNFTGDPQLPTTLRRVVLLRIAGVSVAPAESVTALDAVFAAELQRQNRFEIVTLTRADCLQRFQVEEFSS